MGTGTARTTQEVGRPVRNSVVTALVNAEYALCAGGIYRVDIHGRVVIVRLIDFLFGLFVGGKLVYSFL